MLDRKVVKKFFCIADFIEEQDFLQEQHKVGWKFEGFKNGMDYEFVKCDPDDYIYQLDILNENHEDEKSYLERYDSYGWEYIQKYKLWYCFRKKRLDVKEENEMINDVFSKVNMCRNVIKSKNYIFIPIFTGVIFWNFLMYFSKVLVSNPTWHAVGLICGSILLICVLFLFDIIISIYIKLRKLQL